ncbi:MAG: hypothetical protein EBW82_01650 [Verrucomicrobia bacterium]|nr:hypothetical protein [Verrucomicrobiota bacterium]
MSGHGKKFSVHTSGGDEDPEFQVAPMVDVLLVLLMFFTATTTTEIKSQMADLTLPDAQDAKDREKGEGQFTVNINKMGGLEAQGRTGLDEVALSKLIKDDYGQIKKLNPNASYRVLVRADKDLGWEKTKVVLKAAAAAGYNLRMLEFQVPALQAIVIASLVAGVAALAGDGGEAGQRGRTRGSSARCFHGNKHGKEPCDLTSKP